MMGARCDSCGESVSAETYRALARGARGFGGATSAMLEWLLAAWSEPSATSVDSTQSARTLPVDRSVRAARAGVNNPGTEPGGQA